MSEGLARPGVVLGPYPERAEPGSGVLDRMGVGAVALSRRLTGSGVRRCTHLVGAVNRWGAVLAEESDPQLRSRAGALRLRLPAEGLSRELVAEGFALVREVAGRSCGMRHYDAQLVGGWILLRGMLAEMETGEGKTLTATLPACMAALAGIPVHIVTVNDYLVTRDAEAMGPIYCFLGLRVGAITEGMDAEARRRAYACDITYCSNKQLAFDYLKDRLTLAGVTSPLRLQVEALCTERPRLQSLLLRGLCFAIVDEADSVLIDEARTPLIISRPGGNEDQRRSFEQALALARGLSLGADYLVETRDREVRLTDGGRRRLEAAGAPLGGIWRGRRRREELVRQALVAEHLFARDRHYLLKDGRVQIIDEFTGRVMADRSWERGLHQLIEVKEGVAVSAHKETLARISYQRFFRRYLRLAGMTGTAQEVADELWSVYRLRTVRVPPHRPLRRHARGERLFRDTGTKWVAVVSAIRALHEQGRPILVGTRSVGASEHLSGLLSRAGLPHCVLNARQDEQEAEIIEQAGRRGRITVATNMAGRGTDIRLDGAVVALGGLHVLATERHEAGRIDRQLFGRCARQGDPGSYCAFLSLEDELFTVYGPAGLVPVVQALLRGDRALSGWLSRWVTAAAQRAAERRHARIRRGLLRADERMGEALAFTRRVE